MFDDILNIIIKGYFSLIVLFFVIKMLGKKQISQLNIFDYVIGISLGNLAAEMTINSDISIFLGNILFSSSFSSSVEKDLLYKNKIIIIKVIKTMRIIIKTPTVIGFEDFIVSFWVSRDSRGLSNLFKGSIFSSIFNKRSIYYKFIYLKY